jgi:hypothetical protein
VEKISDPAIRQQVVFQGLFILTSGSYQPAALLEWIQHELERDRTSADERRDLASWGMLIGSATFGEESRVAANWAANLSVTRVG